MTLLEDSPVLETLTPTLDLGPEQPETRGIRRLLAIPRNYASLGRTRYGLRPVLLFSAASLLITFDTRTFQNAAPDIIRATGVNVQGIITITAFVGFAAIFTSMALGWYGDRAKRVPLLGVGLLISGISGMFTGFQRTSLTLGTSRVIDDAATTAADVPLTGLFADYYPIQDRGKVFAIYGGTQRLALLLSLPIGGLMIVRLGLRTTFVVIGGGVAIVSILILLFLREPVRGYFERKAMGLSEEAANTPDPPQSFGEAWRTVFAVRTLRRLFVADMITDLANPLDLFLILLLAEHYHLDAFHRGIVLTLPGIASVLGAVVGGAMLDEETVRNPARMLTIVGAFRAMSGISYVILAFHPQVVLLSLVLSVTFFGTQLVGPAGRSIYSQVIPPSVRTQGLQILNLADIPVYLFAYPIFGAVLAKYGYTTSFLLGVPCFLIGAGVAASAGKFFVGDRRNALSQAIANEVWKQAQAAGRGKMLVCRDIDVEYSGVQVLFGVDFDVEEGDIIALLGTNGAGKSTLLRAISGSQEASNGAIVFDGRDITHMPPHEIAARGVIHMPGGRGVFPGLSVRENLLLGNWMTEDEDEVRTRLKETYDIFPVLAERADTNAGDLSGGEQQQLSLAQAFLAKPRLLMIDELSLGLSPAVVGELLEVVRRIHQSGVTVIVVEQSVNVALALAEKAIFMEKGEIRFFGKTADLLSRPDILRAVYVKGTGALTEGAPAAARQGERSRRSHELEQARPVLEVAGITKHFGGVVALDDVSLALKEGEVLGLIGPNGSGKTTLFDIISGYQRADAGTVTYEGIDVTSMSPEARARRKLVRRFQDARLFPSLTVFETLLIALEQQLEVHSTALGALSAPNSRRAERRVRRRAERLIELLDLGSYRDKFVKELSTGLRRIVDLACVLATEPKVLLLDEPSSGIAQAEAEGLAPLLRRVRFETGCSILIIEHDMPLISAVADELVALERGRVLLRGTADAVLNDERVIESYLGGSEEAVRRSGSLS
jgi:ABC-type branched-subunit amino acid transport system ATPase component/MFS family permease